MTINSRGVSLSSSLAQSSASVHVAKEISGSNPQHEGHTVISLILDDEDNPRDDKNLATIITVSSVVFVQAIIDNSARNEYLETEERLQTEMVLVVDTYFASEKLSLPGLRFGMSLNPLGHLSESESYTPHLHMLRLLEFFAQTSKGVRRILDALVAQMKLWLSATYELNANRFSSAPYSVFVIL
ncbi:hypothetical protein ONZ45_g13085 [Pleurotus djamor]|nr:hypothetical protein ONZ45_g13085 [Pleurotus djamor]